MHSTHLFSKQIAYSSDSTLNILGVLQGLGTQHMRLYHSYLTATLRNALLNFRQKQHSVQSRAVAPLPPRYRETVRDGGGWTNQLEDSAIDTTTNQFSAALSL